VSSVESSMVSGTRQARRQARSWRMSAMRRVIKSEARENHGKYRNWIGVEFGNGVVEKGMGGIYRRKRNIHLRNRARENETFRYPTEIPPFHD
jgi:hypothetical protein